MNDRYTKLILTVIAAALLVLVAQNSIRPSVAESGIHKVQICDGHDNCADLLQLGFSVDLRPGYGIAVATKPAP